jgi:3-phosphoshikimate 1-carboxyvinyltransferase
MGEDAVAVTGGRLRGIGIDMQAMPDCVLTLAAVAARAEGPTRIANVGTLRLKESDRLEAAARELRRLGARVEEGRDFLAIDPPVRLRPARVRTGGDHRVAMSFALLGLVGEGISIEDPDCVGKSFPGFWEELERLRRHHAGP